MTSPILLVLGGGGAVGSGVAQKFFKNGFKVALAYRTVKPTTDETKDFLQIKADFSDPSAIASVFAEVKQKLGVPNVVVYNAYSMAYTPETPLTTPIDTLTSSMKVNFISAYAAAQAAVSGFETLPLDAIKAFIYTGNRLNIEPMPAIFDMGAGKTATAHLIQSLTMTPKLENYRFYYADERQADGSPMGKNIGGENHGDFYYELANKKEQGPWDATFTLGKGYVDFGAK